MTEDEWLACADPRAMVATALKSPRASDRTCRLYVVAFWTWQAQRLSDDLQAAMLRKVATTEHWAETGTLPRGSHADRSENVIFLNKNAKRAMENTVHAPRTWHDPEALAVQPPLIREIFGNPFRPVAFEPGWRTDTAVALAQQMYEAREFGAMPILADALQDAGCDNDEALDHCRSGSGHVRGCWVVDAVLGKG